MAIKKIKYSSKGVTLIEILIAILIFIFVMVGFMKAYTDFMLYLKGNKINSVAKELGEKIRSEILAQSYTSLKNDYFPNYGELTGQLDIVNENYELSIDNQNFYTTHCPFATCKVFLCCTYCYISEDLIPTSGTTCSVGYPIRVGYNAAKIQIVDNATGKAEEVGMAIAVKIYYTEPKTKTQREVNYLIYRHNDGT